MIMTERFDRSFFLRDALDVAPRLIGALLTRRFPDGTVREYVLTELEVYRGEEDKACHASSGRTRRTDIMYDMGGKIYMYLIYGMYWMFNIVTSEKNNPQAILIRGVRGIDGPGRVTRSLQMKRDFYGEDLVTSDRIWIANRGNRFAFKTTPRINIQYAGEEWMQKPWRYVLVEDFSTQK